MNCYRSKIKSERANRERNVMSLVADYITDKYVCVDNLVRNYKLKR